MKFIVQTQPRDLYAAALGSRLIPIQSRNSAKVLLTLDFGESLSTPTRARLVVYDLDDYLTGPLGKQEIGASQKAGALSGAADPRVRPWSVQDVGFFDQHAPAKPLPDALRDPPLGAGVLLKVDLKLNGKPAVAPAKGWTWWSEEPRAKEHPQTEGGDGIEVVMRSGPPARTGKAPEHVVGRIRYRDADLKKHLTNQRRLLIRFVCLDESAPSVGPGTVFLSNICKQQTLAPNPLFVDTAVLRAERGLAPPEGPPPSLPPRRIDPDLTGYYEEIPDDDPLAADRDDFKPAGFLHLNQAGLARVGWYTPYADLGFPSKHTPLLRERFVFRVDPPTPDGGNVHHLTWATPRTGAEDPTALLGEPVDAKGQPTEEWLVGTFEVQDQRADGLHVVVRIRGTAASGEALQVERTFRRLTNTARLPWTVLRELFKGEGAEGDEARRQVIAQQAEPIPISYYLKIGEVVSQKNAALVKAIQSFVDSSDSSNSVVHMVTLRAVSRELMAVFIDSFWGRPKFSEHHTQEIRGLIKTYSEWNSITVKVSGDDVTKTVSRWLQDILFWGLDWLVKKEEKYKAAPKDQVYPKMVLADPDWSDSFHGFVLAGIMAAGEHEYVLQFLPLKSSDLAEDKAAGKNTVGVSFSVGGFLLQVTRRDGGKEIWSRFYTGMLGGLASGLSLSGAGGGVPAPDYELKLNSFFALEPTDFDHAWFRISEVGGPSGGLPIPGLGVKTASNLFCITVERADGTDIELSVIAPFEFALNKDMPDVKKYEKGELRKPTLQLFSIGMTFGILVLKLAGEDVVVPPDKKTPNQPARTDPTQVDQLLFKVGSALIDSGNLGALDVRLATYRRLIEAPGYIKVVGYTSPEWQGDKTGEKNQKLSEDRAAAALDAIKAAVGAPRPIVHKDKALSAEGFGEFASTNVFLGGPLLDPENPELYVPKEMTLDEFKRRIAKEEAQYPAWRRVDVHVNGIVIVKLRQG